MRECVKAPLDYVQQRLAAERQRMHRPYEIELMSLAQLRNEKSSIKKELRFFDRAFQHMNGKDPLKADKEPLRPVYQRYKLVKSIISRAGGQIHVPSDIPRR